ncbi:MAG: hypothetical protein AAFN07_12505, partial [Pseudomonadota bacterium]
RAASFLVWHLMTSSHQSWLRVDQVPGFRSPADALIWACRMYLASVRIGREPSALVDQMLVSVFSASVRDAFKRVMHHLIATSPGRLELKSPTDYELAAHERRLLEHIAQPDSVSTAPVEMPISNEWTSAERQAALLCIHVAFDRFVGVEAGKLWPPEAFNLGLATRAANSPPAGRRLH